MLHTYTYQKAPTKRAFVHRALPGAKIVISFYGAGTAQLFLEDEATHERLDASAIVVRDSDGHKLRVAGNGYFIAWTESYKMYVGEEQIGTISNRKTQEILFSK